MLLSEALETGSLSNELNSYLENIDLSAFYEKSGLNNFQGLLDLLKEILNEV